MRPRSMARNFTVIGPMRAIAAQSKLSAPREKSVASRGGSTRRLSKPCRKGSTKIRTPADAARDGRASVRYNEDADGCHALLDEDAAEGRHRDGVACARLQFDTCTEYCRRQAAYGGGWGMMRPDFRLSDRASSADDAQGSVRLRCRRNRKNIARKPRGDTLHCNRGRLRTLFQRFRTTKTRSGHRSIRPDNLFCRLPRCYSRAAGVMEKRKGVRS